MENFEILTWITAVCALVVSACALCFNGIQAKRSTEALVLQQQLERGNAVMHFTDRFFKFAQTGDPVDRLTTDKDFIYQFWSLLATEFYFFHRNILPPFMFSLWMIDLSKFYCSQNGAEIRAFHTKYLNTYSFNYQEMISFFSTIYQHSHGCDDEIERNKRISKFVREWIDENKTSIL